MFAVLVLMVGRHAGEIEANLPGATVWARSERAVTSIDCITACARPKLRLRRR